MEIGLLPDRRLMRFLLDVGLAVCVSGTSGLTLSLSRTRHDPTETALVVSAILATNSASGFFWAGHADAIGQGREVQFRSAYRHGQGRTRDRREAWSAGRDRTGRRGVSTIEDDRIGTPGGGARSRSADVGRWNGQRGGEKSIGGHAKRSWQRYHQPAAARCVARWSSTPSQRGVRILTRATDRESRAIR